MRKKFAFGLGIGVALAVPLLIFHRFWFPGISLDQSIELWLKETKFASPAYSRVKAQCKKSLQILISTKQNIFTDFQMQRKLFLLMQDCDTLPLESWAEKTIRLDPSIEWRVISTFIIAKNKRADLDPKQKALLFEVLERSHPAVATDRFRANDFLSEFSARALGYLGDSASCVALNQVARERTPSYFREVLAESLADCASQGNKAR